MTDNADCKHALNERPNLPRASDEQRNLLQRIERHQRRHASTSHLLKQHLHYMRDRQHTTTSTTHHDPAVQEGLKRVKNLDVLLAAAEARAAQRTGPSSRCMPSSNPQQHTTINSSPAMQRLQRHWKAANQGQLAHQYANRMRGLRLTPEEEARVEMMLQDSLLQEPSPGTGDPSPGTGEQHTQWDELVKEQLHTLKHIDKQLHALHNELVKEQLHTLKHTDKQLHALHNELCSEVHNELCNGPEDT